MLRELPFRSPALVRGHGEWVEVNPEFARTLAARGITTPPAFLALPGEVVSGHPDRHVLRLELAGSSVFYLKRQHAVTQRERFRNWRAGFGWVSRSAREATILKELSAARLPCPRWVAVGEDNRGRAFLMVEELAETADLREWLVNSDLSARDRARLAERLGRLIGGLHAQGFTTPEATAKHLLVSRKTGGITPIDWQGSRRVHPVAITDRIRALAALHASVGGDLATPRERLRVLRAALNATGPTGERFSELARRITREAEWRQGRRSIRDQRLSRNQNQRLVWVAGEAVCAVPAVAAHWPMPAIALPFYGGEPGAFPIRLPDGRSAHLIRGESFAPAGRLRAWARGRPWRSPGTALGRLLFHLERYGIPAPRLLAFGQKLTSPFSAEWFVLHTPPAPPIGDISCANAKQLGRCLRRLHDADCRPIDDPLSPFGIGRSACIRGVTAIALVKRVSQRDRCKDLRRLLDHLDQNVRPAAEAGYAATIESEPSLMDRLQPERANR